MTQTISEATQAAIDRAEPGTVRPPPPAPFAEEPEFETPAPAPAARKRGAGGRRAGSGRKSKNAGAPSNGDRRPAPNPTPASSPAPAEPIEASKSLVRGCKWILRNVVTVMHDGYGWTEPEDYDAWLVEASQLSANVVQKHFPEWMDRWGDELLLLVIMGAWAAPNVSRKLRERKKPNTGNAGQEGKRENDTVMSFAQSA